MAEPWLASFNSGKRLLQQSRLEEALTEFTRSLEQGGSIDALEHRSLVYSKLGKPKNALLDSQRAIQLNPRRWQSYARAASLFLNAGKWDAASTMANKALERIEDDKDGKRQCNLNVIRERAAAGKAAEREKTRCHVGALPVEMLTSIFLDVVRHDQRYIKSINATCRHWHAIAIATPQLWSTLTTTNKRPLSKAKLWLSRSGNMLRSLRLFGKSITSADHALVKWDMLTRLEMDEDSMPVFCIMCRGNQNLSFDRIDAVCVEFAVDDRPLASFRHDPRLFLISYSFEKQADPFFRLFPNVRQLTLKRMEVPWFTLSDAYTTLVSLEILTGSSMPFEELIHIRTILEHNPNLESLTLSFNTLWGRNVAPTDVTPIELPNLMCLHLTRFPVSINWLFTLYAFPTLQELSLIDCFITRPNLFPESQELKLTRLVLQSIPQHDIPIEIIKHAPAIKEFVYRNSSGANDIIERLIASPCTCPQLSSLDVSKTDIRTGPLTRLVKSRMGETMAEETQEGVQARCRITSLVLDECDKMDADWLPWLRERVKSVSCVYVTKKRKR